MRVLPLICLRLFIQGDTMFSPVALTEEIKIRSAYLPIRRFIQSNKIEEVYRNRVTRTVFDDADY